MPLNAVPAVNPRSEFSQLELAPALELRGVTFGYRGSTPVINDLDLQLSPGSVMAVTGASGSGKSTLLYLAGLLTRPLNGTVLLDGVDCGELSDTERSRIRADRIGFVFQNAALDQRRSLADNVLEGTLYGSGRNIEPGLVDALLVKYGVTVPSSRSAAKVSGGQAQRVALCRAMLKEPALILADEPTGNLDDRNAEAVLSGLVECASGGASVLIVTHSDWVASNCDVVFDVSAAQR